MRPLPREFLFCALAVWLGQSPLVSANTEIVNFGVAPGLDVPLPHSNTWRRLSPNSSEQLCSVLPAPLGTALADVCECEPAQESSLLGLGLGACPHDLWLSIGTDDPAWAAYPKFTLRISWPAFSPADFYIDTYTPEALARLVYGSNASSSQLNPTTPDADAALALTRRTYARIRVINSGVLTPSHAPRYPTPDPVLFMVAVEPLHFGVLPGSVAPTLLAIVAVATVAGIGVVPFVTKRLMAIASEVRAEASREQERKSQ